MTLELIDPEELPTPESYTQVPVDTIVGVETLAEPGYLIEVEAVAVLD